MGTIGDCYDNSRRESLWNTLQLEVLDTRIWKTQAELANTVVEWREFRHSPTRRHSSTGMLSPVEFETIHPPHTSTQNDH